MQLQRVSHVACKHHGHCTGENGNYVNDYLFTKGREQRNRNKPNWIEVSVQFSCTDGLYKVNELAA